MVYVMRCLCPFCGGKLPGRPGHYVRCMHCAETIYWARNKPFRRQEDALTHARACRLDDQNQAWMKAAEQRHKQDQDDAHRDEIASQRREWIAERSRRRIERDKLRAAWREKWICWTKPKLAYVRSVGLWLKAVSVSHAFGRLMDAALATSLAAAVIICLWCILVVIGPPSRSSTSSGLSGLKLKLSRWHDEVSRRVSFEVLAAKALFGLDRYHRSQATGEATGRTGTAATPEDE